MYANTQTPVKVGDVITVIRFKLAILGSSPNHEFVVQSVTELGWPVVLVPDKVGPRFQTVDVYNTVWRRPLQ